MPGSVIQCDLVYWWIWGTVIWGIDKTVVWSVAEISGLHCGLYSKVLNMGMGWIGTVIWSIDPSQCSRCGREAADGRKSTCCRKHLHLLFLLHHHPVRGAMCTTCLQTPIWASQAGPATSSAQLCAGSSVNCQCAVFGVQCAACVPRLAAGQFCAQRAM